MRSENYVENLLYMLDRLNESDYHPNPRLVRIIDKLFIILAENGSSCSTVMMRHLASSGVDPYTALSGAAGALFGERKSPGVVKMLNKIGSVMNVQQFLIKIKEDKISHPSKELDLSGFGHRIYQQCDPRAKIAKRLYTEVYLYLNSFLI